MKKILIGGVVLLLLLATAAYAQFIAPAGGETLCKGKIFIIRWNPASIPTATVHLRLRQGTPGNNTDPPVMKISDSAPNTGSYEFLVPNELPSANNYYLRVRPPDESTFTDSHNFSIKFCIDPGWWKERLYVEYWWIHHPEPGCPMCGVLDLEALLAKLQGVNPGPGLKLGLFANGKLVADLVKFGRGSRMLGKQQVKFNQAQVGLIRGGGSGFEVRLLDAAGKMLFSQPILIKEQLR
ncbi:MAG TPA: GPI anchored serine-threonine rich family protein [Candidatus Aminicenantes bacterium]|nr:GPI anchored serine-threonine rich family protein [Candidatus Aminicenantes bacterium]